MQVEILKKPRAIRHVGIDIVKCVAILSVVGVHFFLNTKFYTTNLNNANLLLQTIIQQLFLVCIPLFLMSTGYLNNNIDISTKHFKKLIPILMLYVLYSIPAILYRAYINEIEFDIPLWISLIFKFKGHRYSWYIDLYIGLFLLMPFLNRMYFSLNTKKEKQILILILMILTSFVSLINGRFIKELHIPTYWSAIYPLTYFFIGKYIRDFQPKMKNLSNILYLVLVVILQGVFEYFTAEGETYRHFFTDYTSALRVLEGYLIFILLYKFDIKNEFVRKGVISISSLTLDIYLASFITDRIVYKELLKRYDIAQESFLYLMIILVVSSFTLAYITAYTRKKLIKIK